jgi:hypothetical protein|tara:strand:- start:2871 stop:3059 length:189 start_codon:yes stop_codon:yes gene_type:complete
LTPLFLSNIIYEYTKTNSKTNQGSTQTQASILQERSFLYETFIEGGKERIEDAEVCQSIKRK